MKKILSIAILFGVLHVASAGTTNLFLEDWGTTNGGSSVTGNGNINTVGWTGVAVSQTMGPYLGIYAATGPTDAGSGAPLTANTLYFTTLLPTQTTPGMFYTTDTSGTGSGGDSSFAAISPGMHSNLTLSVEITGNVTDTNYFAVRIGSTLWYVSTTPLVPAVAGGTVFTNATLLYTNPANVWDSLTIGTTNVTIGAQASPNLAAAITGIGIVELPTTAGFDYNQLAVTAYSPTAVTNPPVITGAISPQYSYVGGGASFLMSSSGTPPLTYIWETNGVPVPSGGRYFGTTNNMLTITNLNANDALISYSVIVTNVAGAATNSGLTLIISNVPPNLLYAEDFPYVGPSGNLPIGPVGWASSASASTVVGIYEAGTGLGDVFSYSPAATTNAYYTTDTNDVGYSGLPFGDINPASYPAITFQAGFVPGNPAGQVSGAISVYWAVEMNGTWYCSAQSVPITLTALSPYLTYQYGFNPAVTNWNNLTLTGTNAIIGSQASSPLTGDITGAGLIVAHNDGSGSDMNFQDFEILTNLAVGSPPVIGTDIPLAVGVASGGGASFGVSATGTPPFTYGWTTNGVAVHDGATVFGSATATLTLANLNSNANNMQIVAFVTNSAGSDESDSIYGATTLTVTNPPIGLLYSEAFPFVGPVVGDYPVSSVGWTEAVSDTPNTLFQNVANTSEGAVFAYLGGAGTTVYYATTLTDTNQSGLPFPNIDLAAYTNLSFSVDIAPNSLTASNVTAYLAVQLNATNWYVAASALPVPGVSNATYTTYTMPFSPAAANWNNLTVTSSGGLIGSPAASNLSGVMTGAGLVFVTVNTGGTFNFANFGIKGSGLGGINVGPLTGGNMNLSWVGNPAVKLQSSTNLDSSSYWQDVPGTYGLYSEPVTVNGKQTFYRLKSP
ncbi:MAG: immunoglobulin domain-containing protein [Verrucomicrobiota bacterium]